MRLKAHEASRFPFERLAELERTVALVYDRFAECFPEDRTFWLTLRDEEFAHEAFLKRLATRPQTMHHALEMYPEFSEDLALVMIERVQTLLKDIEGSSLSRKEALVIAIQLEDAAGEFHYRCLCRSTDSNLFSRLSQEDFEHSARIRAYLDTIRKQSP